ncbi:hypothetical protein CR513_29043, partial [Mucuna pruriens]
MAISRRHEMPQQPILFCEVFDVWGTNFMGSFPISNRYSYILLVIDYFGVPKAIISDQGSHFCNRAMSALFHKYGVVHRIATTYHPKQTAKLKSSIGKSRKHYKRWLIPTERTGANSLRMLYGQIELHTELRWVCLPTK